jgi:hypothetical protein
MFKGPQQIWVDRMELGMAFAQKGKVDRFETRGYTQTAGRNEGEENAAKKV